LGATYLQNKNIVKKVHPSMQKSYLCCNDVGNLDIKGFQEDLIPDITESAGLLHAQKVIGRVIEIESRQFFPNHKFEVLREHHIIIYMSQEVEDYCS
jgi:hypothetical protein